MNNEIAVCLAPKNPTDKFFHIFDVYRRNNINILFIGNKEDDEESFKKIEKYYDNFCYLSIVDQIEKYEKIYNFFPDSHLSKINLGLLEAKEIKAQKVYLIDLDHGTEINYLFETLIKKPLIDQTQKIRFYTTHLPVFCPLQATNGLHQWFRGYPWEHLINRNLFEVYDQTTTPVVECCLINGTSDLDVLGNILFDPNNHFTIENNYSSNALIPFNCLNTVISTKTIEDYFVFPLDGDIGDIIGSYIYQSKHKGKIVYRWPTVKRNANFKNRLENLDQELANQKIIKQLIFDINAYENILDNKSLEAFRIYKELLIK